MTPSVEALPPGLVTLADHEAHARTRLDDNAWAYFSGAAGDEITLRANRHAWDRLALLPRVLQPLAGFHTRVELLGRALAHPLLVAPMAWQRMAHADGEIAMAHAAAAQGAGLVLSTQASQPLEAVSQAFAAYPEAGPLWFQLYLQADRGFTRQLVQRVEAAGYQALVLTVDAPVQGARDRERRAGFRLPPGISAVNLEGTSPAASLLDTAPTWSDVQWLLGITRLPVLLKGVMHPDDARQAAALGVAGLIVSNHGGRTLDTAAEHRVGPAPLWPHATGGSLPLLVDGGIRRGTDVLKALRPGRARRTGWPALQVMGHWPTAGAVGAAHVLRLLRDEYEIAQALCGCVAPVDITGAIVIANATDSHL
jgi:4-hydroxymandelate oxidase